MEIMFGKHNEIRDHRLEKKLIALNPSDFSFIEYYISKFKTLMLLLEDCISKRRMNTLNILLLLSLAMGNIFLYTY
jgi:hypothetical protein